MRTYYIPMADPECNYPTRERICPHVELAYKEGWSAEDIDGGWPVKCPECNPHLAITQCPICGVLGDRNHGDECPNG